MKVRPEVKALETKYSGVDKGQVHVSIKARPMGLGPVGLDIKASQRRQSLGT